MGWLVGWQTRAALVEHLRRGNEPREGWAGLKILAERSTMYGRHLWWACENPTTGERFVMLILIRGSARSEEASWGYKDVDESMGPCEVDCPLDLFELVPEPAGAHQGAKWAREWRLRVRAYHMRRGQVFAPGARVTIHGKQYCVVDRRKRSYIVEREGRRFKASPESMYLVEQVA